MTNCKNCKYTDEYCASGDCNKMQANNLACNKISLTEQWKKGELPDDEYYCRTTHDLSVRKHYLSNIDNENMIEVLAPVPSYEEYLESESHCAVYSELNKCLKEENTKLKELLKECKTPLEVYNEMFGNKEELLTKINEALQ